MACFNNSKKKKGGRSCYISKNREGGWLDLDPFSASPTGGATASGEADTIAESAADSDGVVLHAR